ncbi:MAG: GCN5-related N-acetyltransferase [Anaerocolumna sp.]|jgi:GNAT superfamily N-acetyltransferase|nr:GCN5-related N-acetyltransferase [Anaerocolumna sp.]
MFQIRFVEKEDKEYWYTLDGHLPEMEFNKKVVEKRGYVMLEDGKPIGILRYNLFWDNTPFLNLIFIEFGHHKKGYGKLAMDFWESEMADLGYKICMTSTMVNEESQHFYRKIGYKDCGCLVLDIPGFEQPMEMFLIKAL